MSSTLRAALVCAVVAASSACSQRAAETAGTKTPAAVVAEPAIPEAVNGWREYPLRDGVISIQPARWRTDTIDIPVPAKDELEYKLSMKKGEVASLRDYARAVVGLAILEK